MSLGRLVEQPISVTGLTCGKGSRRVRFTRAPDVARYHDGVERCRLTTFLLVRRVMGPAVAARLSH
jgi:hypothetical protein